MITAILTIDDVASKNTPAIVDYLVSKNITALMFAHGQKVEENWDEAIYALKHGMIIGNHSYSHPAFSKISFEEAVEEIERNEKLLDKLYDAAGVERKYRPFRFPYGDKGGANKEALQKYFKDNKFNKVKDTQFKYDFWHEEGLDTDMDTLWTFDFAEYNIRPNSNFTKEDVWARMHDENPQYGAVLFKEGNNHMLLLHAHDETEEMVPRYYEQFIEHLLENGVTFVKPEFF